MKNYELIEHHTSIGNVYLKNDVFVSLSYTFYSFPKFLSTWFRMLIAYQPLLGNINDIQAKQTPIPCQQAQYFVTNLQKGECIKNYKKIKYKIVNVKLKNNLIYLEEQKRENIAYWCKISAEFNDKN